MNAEYVLVWACSTLMVLSVVAACVIGGVVGGANDHSFDLACLSSGKTIQYVTLQGESGTDKVCK